MKILIKRIDATDQGIFGHLTLDDQSGFTCVTLERHDIAIPEGSYKTVLYNSPAHGLCPLLQGVKNRTMIEIHIGNWESDSKGCILVGKERDGFAIDASHDTFEDLMNHIKQYKDITTVIS